MSEELQTIIATVYRVRRNFKYDGRNYLQGQIWEPIGHPRDRAIIEHRYVFAETKQIKALIADDEPAMPDYESMTVATLRDELKGRNLPTYGIKADLIERLEASDNAS